MLAVSFCFIPLILLSPTKFVALNALGTFTIFISIIIMKGMKVWKSLCSKTMFPFTTMFIVTFLLEIYFSIINKSYILVLVALILHIVSILYIMLSYIPYGKTILNKFFNVLFGCIKMVFGSCFKKGKSDLLPVWFLK